MTEDPIPSAPRVLRDTEWRIEDIAGRPIIEGAPATLQIEVDGRISGRTGCNFFTGSMQGGERAIRFGRLATTPNICPPALMDQEQRLLAALEAARSFSIDERGLLHLEGDYEPLLLRASPV